MRLTLLLALGLAVPVAAQQKEVLDVPGAVAGLPFSPAVKVGNVIYLSGQIGSRIGTRSVVSGGIGAETRQAVENIRTILDASGSSLEDVFKCTVFLTDIADFDAMNKVYAGAFGPEPPARSTVAVRELVLGAKVEIECMAVVGR